MLSTEVKIYKISYLYHHTSGKSMQARIVENYIYVRCGTSRKETTIALPHETAHYLFPDAEEHHIVALHKMLWKKFIK